MPSDPTDELAMERDARERLELLLESAPAIIMALDCQGVITYINWVLPQYDRSKVIGTQFLEFIPPAKRPAEQARLASVLAGGPPSTYETAAIGPGDAEIWFTSRMAPIQRGGQIAGVIIVSENVTEKKRAQLELQASRHLAVLGTLVAGVAHEINTPIQFLGDSITFLREATTDLLKLIETIQGLRMSLTVGGRTPEAMQAAVPLAVAAASEAEKAADLPYLRERMPKAFDRCVEGLDRVATIVRSLKAFAHPSGQGMESANLNEAIGNTLVIAKNEYKYIADVETSFGDLPSVQCNLNEINQVVLNILVNAAHAMGDVEKVRGGRGVISVKTRRDGDDVVISIGDTGSGIPEQIRGRIFDPFFTTKEIGRGTGQGLAIAQNMVVNRHGGRLTFETALGKGTTFFIRLPIAGKAA
jgi:two-component system, NtrC family, sensor kinase